MVLSAWDWQCSRIWKKCNVIVCVCLSWNHNENDFVFFCFEWWKFFVFDFISFFGRFFWCNKSYQYFSILCVISPSSPLFTFVVFFMNFSLHCFPLSSCLVHSALLIMSVVTWMVFFKQNTNVVSVVLLPSPLC